MFHRSAPRPRALWRDRSTALVGVLLLALVVAGCDLLAPTPSSNPTPIAPPAASATAAAPAQLTAPPAPPTETPAPPSPTPQPRTLAGHVLDSVTGKPIAGAHVTGAGAATDTGPAGDFDLGVVPPGSDVQAVAAGYAPATLDSGSSPSVDIRLRPTTLRGRVTDAKTGKPLYGVLVRIDLTPGGENPAAPAISATATVTSSGFVPSHQLMAPIAQATVAPTAAAPVSATGVLTPATATPVPPTPTPPPIMPTPYADDHVILAVTDADGNYAMQNVPDQTTVTFKMPGYKLTKVPITDTATLDQALQPFQAKALYLTANAAAYDPLYKPIMDMENTTELNAIVLNIQDDSSRLVYKTNVQMALDSGAVDLVLPNIKDVIANFHKQGIYVIGRVLTFMQPAVADANPNLAVLSAASGKPWTGGYMAQQRWLDPTNPAARQYPLALAREAVSLGFDEIQFDYIRFPSDPSPGETWDDMSFSQTADDTTKGQYIQQFLMEAHNMLNLTDAFMGVDIFGYTVWPDQNGQPLNASIGQVFPKMVGYTDYIDPMIYPSHFSAGEMGFADPNAHPYEIIHQAGVYVDQRLAGQRAQYRPWLQGFDWNHLVYDGHLYRLQIQAAEETNADGWMFWDPSNVYYNGFNPK